MGSTQQQAPLSGPNLQARLQQLVAQLRQPTQQMAAVATSQQPVAKTAQTAAESLASLLATDDDDDKPQIISDGCPASVAKPPSVNVAWGGVQQGGKGSVVKGAQPPDASPKPVLSRFEQMVPSKVLHHGPPPQQPSDQSNNAAAIGASPLSSQYYKPPTPKQGTSAAKKIAPKPSPRAVSQPPTLGSASSVSSFKPPTPNTRPHPRVDIITSSHPHQHRTPNPPHQTHLLRHSRILSLLRLVLLRIINRPHQIQIYSNSP